MITDTIIWLIDIPMIIFRKLFSLIQGSMLDSQNHFYL